MKINEVKEKKIWAAVGVKPNQTLKAEANLERQGFRTLVPRMKITFRQKNSFSEKMQLMFPGYLFVQIELGGRDINVINSTYGVSKIVETGGRIGVVPNEFINDLKKRNSKPNFDEPLKLNPGQKVEITRGPFNGFIAEILKIGPSDRLSCLFDLMTGKAKVTLSKECLVSR